MMNQRSKITLKCYARMFADNEGEKDEAPEWVCAVGGNRLMGSEEREEWGVAGSGYPDGSTIPPFYSPIQGGKRWEHCMIMNAVDGYPYCSYGVYMSGVNDDMPEI